MTGRPKTSVYFHIRDIPLSPEKTRFAREASGKRIRLFPLGRKGKSNRAFKTIKTWDKPAVFVLAHLLFDGDMRYASCSYNNRSAALIQRFISAMKMFYAYEPSARRDPASGVRRISYYNVALAAHLRQKSQELLREIRMLPAELQYEFIQAFFDDEGCVEFRQKERRRVRGYQKNIAVLGLVQILLDGFGIRSRIHLPNEIVITGKQNLLRFQNKIGFSPGVRVNGNRSNSTWKKHIEKRRILQSAVASYER